MQTKQLTKEQALQKLKQYCLYQERCHSEVRQKLFDLKVSSHWHDEIVTALTERDYLNEERFAQQFVSGKFRLKRWGKKKIQQGLREKQVSIFNIKAAMKSIDDDAYAQRVNKEAEKKFNLLKGEQYLIRKKKTMNYLMQKGYEADAIKAALKAIKTST